MITIINQHRKTEQVTGMGVNDQLWLAESDVERITGWTPEGEGLRESENTVSVPVGREHDFLRDGEVNLAAFWRLMGRPARSSASGEGVSSRPPARLKNRKREYMGFSADGL